MAKYGISSVKGNSLPKVNQDNYYEVGTYYPNTPRLKSYDDIKWKLFVLEKSGGWRELKGPQKLGKKVSYNFPQKLYGHKLLIEAFINNPEKKAPPGIIVTPVLGPRSINAIAFFDSNWQPLKKTPKYGQSVNVRITTTNMFGETLKVSLWERDTVFSTGHDDKANTNIWGLEKEFVVKKPNGIVEFSLVLDPAWRLKAEGKFEIDFSEHEYYLVVRGNGAKAKYSVQQNVKDEVIKQGSVSAKGIGVNDPSSNIGKTVTSIDKIKGSNNKNEKESGNCYCYSQGIVDVPCGGKGSAVTDAHFESLAKDIGVEAKVFKAVAIVESGGKKSFITLNGQQKAKILYERHYMYRFLKKMKSEQELLNLKKETPDLVHNIGTYKDKNAKYGSESEQYKKLVRAKKLDNDSAIKSCSWGKFQVMGKYYDYLYGTPNELEEAMHLCEVQHFAYFKVYLKDVSGAPMVNAMKNKNWDKIAELYNGADYAINNYHTKMKNTYDKL